MYSDDFVNLFNRQSPIADEAADDPGVDVMIPGGPVARPGGSLFGPETGLSTPEQIERFMLRLLQAQYKPVNFLQQSFTVTNAAVLQVRPQEKRGYLLIQNNSNDPFFVGFGFNPTAATGVQLIGSAVYEPFSPPGNAINIIGSVVTAQVGVIIWADLPHVY